MMPTPLRLTHDEIRRIREDLEKSYRGDYAGKIEVLKPGVTYRPSPWLIFMISLIVGFILGMLSR